MVITYARLPSRCSHIHTPCHPLPPPLPATASVHIHNLQRDYELMTPNKDPKKDKCPVLNEWRERTRNRNAASATLPPFETTMYEHLIIPPWQKEEQEARLEKMRMPPWLAAFPTQPLQETSVQRSQHEMGICTKDVRWQVDEFVLLRADLDSTDPFWVGRITKSCWVQEDECTGNDEAYIQVLWYGPTSTAGYRGYLRAMQKDRQPWIDTQELVSVYEHFTPLKHESNPRLIKVPPAVYDEIAEMVKQQEDAADEE